LGVLVHGEAGSDDRQRYRANLESVRREFPDAIAKLVATPRETRNMLRDRGLRKPDGVTYADIPLIKIETAFWKPHFNMFARKLLLALHYQCFSASLPSTGGIWSYVNTNVDFAANEYPREVLEMAEHVALPTRQKQLLGDQFSVRWNFVADSRTAIFLAQLHNRFVVSGITSETPEAITKAWKEETAHPFQPALE
jgi:hypothetical protein